MITGEVTAGREAELHLNVLDNRGKEQEVRAIVDTGYNGWLTLPPYFITSHGLRWRRFGRARLADGSTIVTDVYDATVMWDGFPLAIIVDEADADPLVGMSLMYGYDLHLRIVDGGTFTLQRLAEP